MVCCVSSVCTPLTPAHPHPFNPTPSPSSTCKAVGFGCCGSGYGSSYCRPGTGWRSWRRKAEESGCRWWGNQAGAAAILDPSGLRAVGRCGSGSGQRRGDGGSAEPAVPPVGCVAQILAPLSAAKTEQTTAGAKQSHVCCLVFMCGPGLHNPRTGTGP